jgi:hypothetical protein
MTLTGNCPDMISKTKIFLASKFEIKDMGTANYVLGIRIYRDRNTWIKKNIWTRYLKSLK